MTFDECLELETKEVQNAIQDIVNEAGTYDADWKVLQAAGRLLAEARNVCY